MQMTKYELFGFLASTVSFFSFVLVLLYPLAEPPILTVANSILAYLVIVGIALALLAGLKRWFDYSKLYILLNGYLLLAASVLFLVGEAVESTLIWSVGVIYVVIIASPITLILMPLDSLVTSFVEAEKYTILYFMPLTAVFGALFWTIILGLAHKLFVTMKVKYYGR